MIDIVAFLVFSSLLMIVVINFFAGDTTTAYLAVGLGVAFICYLGCFALAIFENPKE